MIADLLFQLLVGIKDTNDEVVRETLIALSYLVPLLGAEIVIGGKRAKLFNDGRPNESSHISYSIQQIQTSSSRVIPESILNSNVLTERQRPDGEEGSESQVLQDNEEDLDKWDDWNAIENTDTFDHNHEVLENQTIEIVPSNTTSGVSSTNPNNKNTIPDICHLDIKNQVHRKDEDIDFFEDMEPVINSSNKFLIDEQNDIILVKEINNKLAFNTVENSEEGWGNEWD